MNKPLANCKDKKISLRRQEPLSRTSVGGRWLGLERQKERDLNGNNLNAFDRHGNTEAGKG